MIQIYFMMRLEILDIQNTGILQESILEDYDQYTNEKSYFIKLITLIVLMIQH
jgi:hypothetical protein